MNDIKLFESNKGLAISTDNIIRQIKDSVFNGEVPALETGIMLKKISKISEDIFKDEVFKTAIRDETIKSFEGKTYKGYGMTISERATRTYYDFEICGCPIWNALNQIQLEIKELIKAREEELKAMIPKESKISFGIASTEHTVTISQVPVLNWEPSGEQVEIKQPIKYQTTGLVYTEDKL